MDWSNREFAKMDFFQPKSAATRFLSSSKCGEKKWMLPFLKTWGSGNGHLNVVPFCATKNSMKLHLFSPFSKRKFSKSAGFGCWRMPPVRSVRPVRPGKHCSSMTNPAALHWPMASGMTSISTMWGISTPFCANTASTSSTGDDLQPVSDVLSPFQSRPTKLVCLLVCSSSSRRTQHDSQRCSPNGSSEPHQSTSKWVVKMGSQNGLSSRDSQISPNSSSIMQHVISSSWMQCVCPIDSTEQFKHAISDLNWGRNEAMSRRNDWQEGKAHRIAILTTHTNSPSNGRVLVAHLANKLTNSIRPQSRRFIKTSDQNGQVETDEASQRELSAIALIHLRDKHECSDIEIYRDIVKGGELVANLICDSFSPLRKLSQWIVENDWLPIIIRGVV